MGAHLVFVFGDVGVDLVQRRHAVELAEVQAGLLCQVGTHVLVADGRHAGDIGVIPRGEVGQSFAHICIPSKILTYMLDLVVVKYSECKQQQLATGLLTGGLI